MKVRPDEVYKLAGLTSVSLSFQRPVETMKSNLTGTLYLLEALRFAGDTTKFHNACSSECFGDTPLEAASGNTPIRPKSPYAVSKAYSLKHIHFARRYTMRYTIERPTDFLPVPGYFIIMYLH